MLDSSYSTQNAMVEYMHGEYTYYNARGVSGFLRIFERQVSYYQSGCVYLDFFTRNKIYLIGFDSKTGPGI